MADKRIGLLYGEMNEPFSLCHLVDIAANIRKGFTAKGVVFSNVTWRDTEDIVEAAILPLREEIERLRNVLRVSSGVLASPSAQR